MEYTRNSDLSYYDESCLYTNCGSYALRLNEWYDPGDYLNDIIGDVYDWVNEMGNSGYSDLDISIEYGDLLIHGMLKEFEGELEICDGKIPTSSNVELIAFNTMCEWNEGENVDYDFHFKVFRDGKWMEKCGANKVRECDEDEWGIYIGDVTYLYHKIGDENGKSN